MNSVLYKMDCQEVLRLSDEEWEKYSNKDMLKMGTCLYEEFLKVGAETVCCDTEFRDFDSLDEAAEWILTATNEKIWEYVAQIKFGNSEDFKEIA